MHPRQDIVELFSTFVQFADDRFSGWLTDPRLRRSMQHCLNQWPPDDQPSTAESWWALYWHQRWENEATVASTLAVGHLSAYLQEVCYWSASHMTRKLPNSQYGLSDCFQLAIADVHIVLKGFKRDRGASLKTFATIAFPRLLKDMLRQRQVAHFCSDVGLLRLISKKRLLEALKQAGLPSTTMAQYQLAWMCFNAIYVPTPAGSNQRPPADRSLWLSISQRYNLERRNQLDPASPDCSPETLERWLNQCANLVRNYLYPPIDSLNRLKAGLEPGGEIQDDLSAPINESLLTELIQQEEQQTRHEQQLQLHHHISQALETLEAQSQELLRLYYQQGLTQQQMMQALHMSQATVSRRLTKAREALLLAIVQGSQKVLNNPPNPNLIKDMSAALEEWLRMHYGVPNPVSGSGSAGKETEP